MKNQNGMTRRTMLRTMALGTAVGVAGGMMGAFLPGQKTALGEETPAADPRVRGPFPILSTPFTESGEVDYEVLAKEARFVDWCGSSGMIWPQSGDSVDLLTMEEKLHGMEVLAETMKNRTTALCLGVQGKDTEEMLIYARHAEKLAPTAIISRPPDDGKTEDDLRQYWHTLSKVVTRPVIIQTSGGTKYGGPSPSVPLLIELARDLPQFGYVKEEVSPITKRMKELTAAKPTIKTVFSAMGGFGWMHQFRFGSEGLVTERAVYADLLAKIWKFHEEGNDVAAADIFGKFLLMLNLKETISAPDLRGYHLYLWQKRGIFKNRLSRNYGPKNAVPEKPILSEQQLSREDIEEIDTRFEAIRPALREGEFEG